MVPNPPIVQSRHKRERIQKTGNFLRKQKMPCATSRIAAVAAAFVCLVLVVRVILYYKKENVTLNVIKGCPGRSLCPLSVESDRTTDLFCVEDSTWGREFVTRVATSWEPLTRRLLNEEVCLFTITILYFTWRLSCTALFSYIAPKLSRAAAARGGVSFFSHQYVYII